VHRQLKLTGQDDATGLLTGRLSPTCRAIWQTILTALANCRPDDALGPDDRTIPQRWHDAFEEAGRRLLAVGDLPNHAGLPCQLVVTVSLTDLERRAGRATTQHGGTLSIAEALQLAADATVLPQILNDTGGVLAHGTGRRLATPGLRKAIIARDRGCTGQRWPNRPRQPGHRLRLPQQPRTPPWLADGADRRRAALATTTLAPNPRATTELPTPSGTADAATYVRDPPGRAVICNGVRPNTVNGADALTIGAKGG
jgi:hypothetical protein